MNIFIKESLYLLDYNDNVLDVLFLSTDKDTPGQAYEINIKENNTGYSDLTFKMPAVIINEDGEKIVNPKLQILNRSVEGLDRIINTGLVPLSKVRYERLVRYMGTETISFPGPNGETITYPKNDGSHPDDYIIEDYIMDYIIQPMDKNRQNLKIDLTYTAIDYPRFTLSKKKLGFTTDDNTITTPELSLFTNIPMNVPGKVTYIPWTAELAKNYQATDSVDTETDLYAIKQPSKGEVYYVGSVNQGQSHYFQYDGETWINKEPSDFITWTPNPQSGGYPLSDASIKKLVHETTFTNGILATVYYWPVVIEGNAKTARFEGVTYEENSFITLSLYNTYEGIESAWEGSEYLEDIAWDWNYLEPIQLYLNPNNACNLLRYILKNTNWSVANDGGVLFKKNTAEQPWYTEEPELDPSEFVEGTYYIVQQEVSGIRPYSYTIKQVVDGSWVDKTDELLQYVNTDETDISNFGVKYDIDIEQKEVSRTAEGSIGQIQTMDAQYSLSISNANCYNAITTEAKLFDLYPIFDCVNKTVTLKMHAGADYGLTYRVGRNLKTSSIKLDGEKVITKLYVTGGQDTQGSVNINLGEAVREVEGYSPTVISNTASNYINNTNETLRDNMKLIQQTAYDDMVGKALENGGDYTTQKLILDFPDTLAYETLGLVPYNDPPDEAQSGYYIKSSIKNLVWVYDNVAHCFYVCFSTKTELDPTNSEDKLDFLDEDKQLYKFDFSNIKVRRNLEEWPEGYIGNNVEIVSGFYDNNKLYVKYHPGIEMEEPNHLFLNDKAYVGYSQATTNDGSFVLDYIPKDTSSQDESFVLAGPAQVYEADETTQAFTEGKYYHFDDKYYYCAGKVNLQHDSQNQPYYNDNGSLDYINRISVNGYIFVDLGDGSDSLTIVSGGTSYTVKKKNDLGSYVNATVSDWLSNGYAIRVLPEDNILKEVYPLNEDTGEREFNPNAPEYLVSRSPYGTSYIYNFKYLYDNEWMTENDILDIYRINRLIHADNLDFFNRYAQELTNARAAYLDAINNLELYESKGDAQLETLMSQYWQNPMVASKGKFSAFPYHPKKVNIPLGSDYDTNKKMYKENITYNGEVVKTVFYNVYNSNGTNYLYPNHKNGLAKPENPETEGQYHVVAKAIGWEDYKEGKLPLDETFPNLPEAKDPSDTITNYNKIINNMKLYYYKAKVANEELNASLTIVEELEEAYNVWQNRINGYERELQEKYGQYIIEGSYNNSDQPYANLLLKDGLKASDLYAIPDVTYGVGVIDASGMIEYRAPQNLICNDLVKKLHGLGQIVPKSGDYVHIYDEEMGLFNVPGLITAINRRIDDPYQNTLTIDTSYTDADELVGQIITATNTILNNKDIYGRAAIIDSKGNLSTGTVTDALSTGKNGISITSTNGKIVVDNNGLTATNPENDQSVMRYNGTGVLGSSNGGITWRSLMTQDGINANYLDAGTINTTKVSVTNGQYDTVVLDSNGLTIKQRANQPYSIGYATENGIDWSNGSNVAVFVGKDVNNTGIGYFEGYIKATQGGEIGGWTIGQDRLYSGEGSTYTALSSSSGYAFWAGATDPVEAPVSITHNGAFKAANAEITGKVTATSGEIGGWKIDGKTLKASGITLNANGSLSGGTDYTWSISKNGKATFKYVTISEGGKVGNFTISSSKLSGGSISGGTISGSAITGGSINISTKGGGYLKAGTDSKNVRASGLTIGGDGLDMAGHNIGRCGRLNVTVIGPYNNNGVVECNTDFKAKKLIMEGTTAAQEAYVRRTTSAGVDSGYYHMKWTYGILTYLVRM